jgi:hypothetical protein
LTELLTLFQRVSSRYPIIVLETLYSDHEQKAVSDQECKVPFMLGVLSYLMWYGGKRACW